MDPDVVAVAESNTAGNEVCFIGEDGAAAAAACVEFPPALTPLERAGRALKFYSRVIPVLGAYKLQQTKIDAGLVKLDAEEEQAAWAEIDEWGSARIAETINDLKGFYVKTGQVCVASAKSILVATTRANG